MARGKPEDQNQEADQPQRGRPTLPSGLERQVQVFQIQARAKLAGSASFLNTKKMLDIHRPMPGEDQQGQPLVASFLRK